MSGNGWHLVSVFAAACTAAACGGRTTSSDDSGDPSGGPCSSRECRTACPEPARFAALVSASERLSAYVETASAELIGACNAIAGATYSENGSCGEDVTNACDAAESRIESELATASASISVAPGRCVVDHEFAFECEARCAEEARCACPEPRVEDRCEPGSVSGECTGACEGSCTAAGSPVACEQSCAGICSGNCGSCRNVLPDGRCAECEGPCSSCDGECSSSDRHDCTGTCRGACTVDWSNPQCEGSLTVFECACPAAADCFDACAVAASLPPTCTLPRLWVAGSLDAEFTASLESDLPTILRTLGSLEVAFEALYDLVENIEDFEDDLSARCLESGGEAVVDARAAATEAASCASAMAALFVPSTVAAHVSP